MSGRNRLRTLGLAAVLVASGSTNAFAAADSGRWTLTELTPEPPQYTYLAAVAPVTASDVWAVGAIPSGQTSLAAVTHWDGRQWQAIESIGEGWLTGVAAINAADVWAVGSQDTGSTLAAHWDGRNWTKVPTPEIDNAPKNGVVALASVAPVAGNDVWAAGCAQSGSRDNPSVPIIQHWNGTRWTNAALPPLPHVGGGCLTDILPLASDNIWAVGLTTDNSRSYELTMHWDGAKWTVLPATPESEPGTSRIPTRLAAVNGTDVWAVGSSVSNGSVRAVILHRVGDRWQPIREDGSDGQMNGIVPDGHGGLVIAGRNANTADCFVLHGVDGSWKTEEVPAEDCRSIYALGVVPGTDTIWAVGDNRSYRPLAAYSPNWK